MTQTKNIIILGIFFKLLNSITTNMSGNHIIIHLKNDVICTVTVWKLSVQKYEMKLFVVVISIMQFNCIILPIAAVYEIDYSEILSITVIIQTSEL